MDPTLEAKVRQSLQVLREHLPVDRFSPEYPLVVNFSGGKDSTACLLLARQITEHVVCFYMDAGFELPGTLDYVKARARDLNCKLIISDPVTYQVPHRDGGNLEGCKQLWDYIRRYKYFPTSSQRWCSIYCKQRPGKTCLRHHFGKQDVHKLVGVKQADSSRRRNVYGEAGAQKYGGYYVRPDREMTPTKLVYPILHWESQDCKDYILDQGYELHEGYKLFGVSGCAWCPVYKPQVLRAIYNAHPQVYEPLLRVEEELGIKAYIHADRTLREVLDNEDITHLKPLKRVG